MTKLEELKAASDAARDAVRVADAEYAAASDAARAAYGAAYAAYGAAYGAYQAELKKTQENNND